MPIYEVHASYTMVEVHYVRAANEDEASCNWGADTLYRTYDGPYDDDVHVDGEITEEEYKECGYDDS